MLGFSNCTFGFRRFTVLSCRSSSQIKVELFEASIKNKITIRRAWKYFAFKKRSTNTKEWHFVKLKKMKVDLFPPLNNILLRFRINLQALNWRMSRAADNYNCQPLLPTFLYSSNYGKNYQHLKYPEDEEIIFSRNSCTSPFYLFQYNNNKM